MGRIKLSSKFISFVMALVMAVGLCPAPSFADELSAGAATTSEQAQSSASVSSTDTAESTPPQSLTGGNAAGGVVAPRIGVASASDSLSTQSQTKGSITVNATSITLYYYARGYDATTTDSNGNTVRKFNHPSIPSTLDQSYQIKVTGTSSTPTYSTSRLDNNYFGNTVATVDANGLVTTARDGEGSGTITVSVDGQSFQIALKVVDYVGVFFKQETARWTAANITSSMSAYEKVVAIRSYSGYGDSTRQFSYSSKYDIYTAEGLVFTASGDCWAGASLVKYLCDQQGIQCRDRNANREPYAGSGHRNDIVYIAGQYYIVDGTPGGGPAIYKNNGYETDTINGVFTVRQYDGFMDTDVVIPNDLNNGGTFALEDFAFERNSDADKITSVTIPKNVSSIGEGCFNGLKSCTAYNVAADNPNYTSVDGVLFNKDKTQLIAYPSGRTASSYAIPSGVTTICKGAFENSSNLLSVTMPTTMRTIEENAFYRCTGLTSVNVSEGVQTIGNCAFEYCGALCSLTVPSTVTSLGDDSLDIGPKATIKVLSRNATCGADVFGYYKTVLGYAGSTVQTYLSNASNGLTKGVDFYALDNGYVPVASVLVAQKSVALQARQTFTPTVTYSPSNATATTYCLTSSDSAVVETLNNKSDSSGVRAVATGTATITVHTSDGPTTTFTVTVTDAYDVANANVSDIPAQSYTGGAIQPTVEVMSGYALLQLGTDYTVSYSNNVNVGTATATITGKGNYHGTKSATFSIVPAPVRLAGGGSLDTMKAITGTGWSDGSGGTVIVATDGGYYDALTASALAGVSKGCVLLTNGGRLSSQTASELARIKPSKVIVAGGPGAVTEAVRGQIATAAGLASSKVVRVYGDGATDTADAIWAEAKAEGLASDTCVIATSDGFADALSVAPAAYAKGYPIFLAGPHATLSAHTIAAIKAAGFTKAVVVGGEGVLPVANIDKVLQSKADIKSVSRCAGKSCFQTSSAVAKWEIGALGMKADNLAVATADSYSDALCGAALCGKNGSILVLAVPKDTSCITGVVHANRASVSRAYLFGGTGVLPDDTIKDPLVRALG